MIPVMRAILSPTLPFQEVAVRYSAMMLSRGSNASRLLIDATLAGSPSAKGE